MAELLAYLARELVDDPEAVRVEAEERDGALVLLLHVAPGDVGKVIGRGGRIVRALRTVVRAGLGRGGRGGVGGEGGGEAASENSRWFEVGARLLAGDAEVKVVGARRGAGGRPVIRTEPPLERGTA